ncbi:hypothetical protein CNR33_00018 [Pseudomonas phage tabernarius]|uniref:Uncharacterized protein n=1 Tax=Pseudomonas phage tabernarius TaxID=2048978 RepID=A0A2H4P6Q5_9CAUD|nr:hypothetical protein FDJ17_gp18 [Pseudomonas phage tabernarius]ATW57864.1 hypothetical protein CNR33_00018 [Pseudomonas phage tabernarius]
MKLNNLAVSVMNFFVKLSFWILTVFCALALIGAFFKADLAGFGAILLVWVVGVLIWAVLSSGWLVLSKIAAHLESIDRKTPDVTFGFDKASGEDRTQKA